MSRTVLAGLEVHDLFDLLPAFAVDAVPATLALAARVALGDHLFEQLGLAEFLAEHVALVDVLVERLGDVRAEVEAHEVHELEDARVRNAEVATGQRVGFFNRHAVVFRSIGRCLNPERAQAVRDEARRVLTVDNLLAQRHVTGLAQRVHNVLVGVVRRHQLQQLHVARRVEEVRDGKALGPRRVHAVGEDRQRNGRGVRGDDGIRLHHARELLVKILLDVSTFDDDLDDPVHVREAVEVVFEVTRRDVLGAGFVHEGGWIGLQRLLDRAFGHSIPVRRAFWHDVEQVDFETSVGALSGDAHAHNARADDGYFFDVSHWFVSGRPAA